MMPDHATALHPLTTNDLEVQMSPIHGLGVFARRDFPEGALIGRYEGKRYDPGSELSVDNTLTYLFVLSDGATIDGAIGGNATRHLNHACEPNCEAHEEEGAAGLMHIVIRATRRILQGEELYIDYNLQIDGNEAPEDYACRCGASSCRGTMVGVERAEA